MISTNPMPYMLGLYMTFKINLYGIFVRNNFSVRVMGTAKKVQKG